VIRPTPRSRARLVAPVAFALGLAALTGGCTSSAPAALVSSDPAPAPTQTEDLLTETPGTGTASGELVPGFPTDLVPVPAGATVLVSSAQPQADGSVQISLNVSTAQETDALVEAVRAPLLVAGFVEVAPTQPDPSLAAQTSFTRSDGAELLLVGVLDRDGTRTMTLGGRVVP
jgi:hypothetical protein